MIKSKRGQFYLIAAVIIIGILLGFASVNNSIKKEGIDKSKQYELFVKINMDRDKVIREDLNYIDQTLDKFIQVYSVDKIYIIIKKDNGIQKYYSYENGELKPEDTNPFSGYDFNLQANSYVIVFSKGNSQYAVNG